MKFIPALVIITFWQLAFAVELSVAQAPAPKPTVKKHKKSATKPAVLDNALVFVQGGSFNMGSNDLLDYAAQPVHKVTISSFNMGKFEVTVGEFRKFINATNYKTTAEQDGYSYAWVDGKFEQQSGVNWQYDGFGFKRTPAQDNQPVIFITWDDANRYCQWLSSQKGKLYRLPTEAEWEYAARGGSKSKGYQYSGSNNLADVAWFGDDSNGQAHNVGQKKPNELGIYDMGGNVWEWCQDWFANEYYANSPEKDPQGPETGSFRVDRGGDWHGTTRYCRVGYRGSLAPRWRTHVVGFRIVSVP